MGMIGTGIMRRRYFIIQQILLGHQRLAEPKNSKKKEGIKCAFLSQGTGSKLKAYIYDGNRKEL